MENTKTYTDIVHNIVSSAAIILGGAWAFYVFVLNRGHAVNVKVNLNPRYKFIYKNQSNILLQVTAENPGHTKAKKHNCFIGIQEMELKSTEQLMRVDTAFNRNQSMLYPVFEPLDSLEPNEKVSEDIVVAIDPEKIYKVAVYWYESKPVWSSVHVIYPAMLKDKPSSSDGKEE